MADVVPAPLVSPPPVPQIAASVSPWPTPVPLLEESPFAVPCGAAAACEAVYGAVVRQSGEILVVQCGDGSTAAPYHFRLLGGELAAGEEPGAALTRHMQDQLRLTPQEIFTFGPMLQRRSGETPEILQPCLVLLHPDASPVSTFKANGQGFAWLSRPDLRNHDHILEYDRSGDPARCGPLGLVMLAALECAGELFAAREREAKALQELSHPAAAAETGTDAPAPRWRGWLDALFPARPHKAEDGTT